MITYREARLISTGNYENVKIELEYHVESNESASEISAINRIKNLLDEREKEIRGSKTQHKMIEEIPEKVTTEKELTPFQVLYNNVAKWIAEKGEAQSDHRRKSAMALLDYYGVDKLRYLDPEKYEEYFNTLKGVDNVS